jgi:chromosome partitioning protein
MARTISLANQKGGVGKTTTAITLGSALAELGQRVLLVDFDPQGAATVGVGLNPNELDVTIYNLLLDRSVSPAGVVAKSPKAGVDVLPANIDLAAAEVVLVSEVAREQALSRALAPLQDEYDFILVDCPPSLGLLTVNALTASNGVIIPMECEFFALRGMALLVDTIEKVRERLNPELHIEGIVATMYDSRTLHAREVLERVKEAFGEKLFRTAITRTIRFAEAPVAGEAILTYAPASAGASQYRALAKEVLGIDDQTSELAPGGRALPADDAPAGFDFGVPGPHPGAIIAGDDRASAPEPATGASEPTSAGRSHTEPSDAGESGPARGGDSATSPAIITSTETQVDQKISR